jgi:hypothetical protein
MYRRLTRAAKCFNTAQYIRFLFLLLPCLLYVYYSLSLSTIELDTARATRIMYVVRTNSNFYHKRLIYLLQTWMSLIHGHAFFVTDTLIPNISRNHQILTHKLCGVDKRSMTLLCCKTAHDFRLFYRYFLHYDWFCHFDDDQYVHTTNLNKYLSTLDYNQAYYIGRNSWSNSLQRSKNPHPRPFWFATLGAGVCLSKHTVDLLRPYTTDPIIFANGCRQENYHDDIYLGFLLGNYFNVSLTKNDRFHSHLEKTFYNNTKQFLQTLTKQITFGFRLPDRYPSFLPQLYASDPYRMRSLHCLLNPNIEQCQTKLLEYLLNATVYRQ